MGYGVPTTREPKDPARIYMRNLYHTFFWGPFGDEEACAKAIRALDQADPMWDYDPFCIIYGADPLPSDFVHGFPTVPTDIRQRILEKARAVRLDLATAKGDERD